MSDQGYGLDPKFELLVLLKCATKPSFWKRIGGQLDPKRMGNAQAPYILAACRNIMLDQQRPPTSTITVMQRIMRWHAEGKLKIQQVNDIADVFDQADDLNCPTEDDMVAELVPVVRRRMHGEAVLKAHDEFARRGDFKEVTDIVAQAARLGEIVAIEDAELTGQGLSLLDEDEGERLRTGIIELDVGLDGGITRGSEGVVMADPGGGKSVFLVQQAAEGSRLGLHVMFATLELSAKMQLARLTANITGIPINAIVGDANQRQVARARLAEMEEERGPVHVAEFSAYATTVRDLVEWVDQKEQTTGRKVDLLVVDYADKMWDPRSKDGNEYLTMRYVYEGLRRDIAIERGMWVWTASQPGRRGRKDVDRKLDMSDVADSIHKSRVADLVLTLNYADPEDFSAVDIFVAKHRIGRSRFSVGPLPTDFSRARISAALSVPF